MAPLSAGQSLGRYHILEQLGEGGMATVYKALDTHLERQVAIKVIRREALPPEMLSTVLARFEREAKSLARLSHPNIIKVHDFGEYEGAPYLVMEYVPGGTLKRFTGTPMPWKEALRLLLPVMRAVSYAHSQNIIHRDIKPANILITATGEPMLSDFGIAKILEAGEGTTLTGTGVGIGTPEYMAPEQGIGQPIDQRTDIYATGVVLYELVTGRRPFVADTPMAVVLKHVTDPLPSPKKFVPDLPNSVEWILAKALAKQAEDRYPDMDSFVSALERLVTSPVEAASPPAIPLQEVASPTEATPSLKESSDSVKVGRSQPLSISIQDQKKTGHGFSSIIWVGLGVLFFALLVVVGVLGNKMLQMSSSPRPTDTAWVQAYILTETQTATLPPPTATLTPFPTTPVLSLTPRSSPTPGVGVRQISPVDGMDMVYVPAGEFLMGASDQDAQAESDERPMHRVWLDAFWIDKTEVTNAMYAACVNSGVCSPPFNLGSFSRESYFYDPLYASYPVVNVTWEAATTYCRWTSRRLPSEAEWEKAARGSDGRKYPWGNSPPDFTLLNSNMEIGDTTAVGSYPSGVSPYGALDMAGNVWEWVGDWYAENYYAASPNKNPVGPASGVHRVMRGGAFYNMLGEQYPRIIRVTFRGWLGDDFLLGSYGFRCAQSPSP